MQLLSSSTGSPQVALPQSSPTDNDVNCTNLHVSGNTKLGDTYDSATEVFGTLTVSDTLVAGYEVVSNSTLTSVRVSSLTVSSIDGGAPAIDAAGVPTILGALTADSGSFSDTVIANSLYSRGSITARDLSTFTISTDSASVTGTVNSGDVVTGVVNASSYVQSTLFYTDTLAAYNGDYLSFDPFVLTHQYIATPTIQTIDMGPQGGTMLNIKAYPSTLTIDVWNHGGANDLTSVVNFCARGSAQPILRFNSGDGNVRLIVVRSGVFLYNGTITPHSSYSYTVVGSSFSFGTISSFIDTSESGSCYLILRYDSV